MYVTVDMIARYLKRQDCSVTYRGDPECVIGSVDTIADGRREGFLDHTLYVASSDDEMTFPLVSGQGGSYAFLEYRAAHVDSPGTPGIVWKALLDFEGWDARLKEAVQDNVPTSRLLEIAEQFIPYSFGILDNELECRTMSSHFADDNPELHQTGGYGISDIRMISLPMRLKDTLMRDTGFRDTVLDRKPYYCRLSKSSNQLYCTNLFLDGRCLSRFCVTVPSAIETLPSGDRSLVDHFASYLAETVVRRSGHEEVALEKNNSLISLFRRLCLEKDSDVDSASVRTTLRGYGWNDDDTYILILFRFSNGMGLEALNAFVTSYVLDQWPASCATAHDRTVLWLCNLTVAEADPATDPYMPIVSKLTSEYLCKAGVSDTFRSFSNVRNYYHEALNALRFGEFAEPELWCYRFRTYAFDYLKHLLTAEFDAKLLCHHGLLELETYDEQHRSGLVDTLSCFLKNNQNVTRTAEDLFLHRTSLMRRLTLIEKVADISLHDPQTVQYLVISLIMLGRADWS